MDIHNVGYIAMNTRFYITSVYYSSSRNSQNPFTSISSLQCIVVVSSRSSQNPNNGERRVRRYRFNTSYPVNDTSKKRSVLLGYSAIYLNNSDQMKLYFVSRIF